MDEEKRGVCMIELVFDIGCIVVGALLIWFGIKGMRKGND